VVLGQVPQSGERTFQHAFSIGLGRVEDYFFDLEASGVAPSEKDIKAIVALARIAARGLPHLWENPEDPEPSTDSPTFQSLKKLSPAGRQRVCAFLTTLMNAAAEKASAQSEGSK
jgi:hypothetical protein